LLGANLLDHDLPASLERNGICNRAGEGDGAVHGGRIQLQEIDGGMVRPGGVGVLFIAFIFFTTVHAGVNGADLLLAQTVVAADEFDGIIQVQFSIVRLELLRELLFH